MSDDHDHEVDYDEEEEEQQQQAQQQQEQEEEEEAPAAAPASASGSGVKAKGRGHAQRGHDDSHRGGHYESIDEGAAAGPAKSVEGWVVIVTGVHEEAQVWERERGDWGFGGDGCMYACMHGMTLGGGGSSSLAGACVGGPKLACLWRCHRHHTTTTTLLLLLLLFIAATHQYI